jgi:hypothetical protein
VPIAAAWFNFSIFAGDKSWVAGVELATASEPPARKPRIWGRRPRASTPATPRCNLLLNHARHSIVMKRHGPPPTATPRGRLQGTMRRGECRSGARSRSDDCRLQRCDTLTVAQKQSVTSGNSVDCCRTGGFVGSELAGATLVRIPSTDMGGSCTGGHNYQAASSPPP